MSHLHDFSVRPKLVQIQKYATAHRVKEPSSAVLDLGYTHHLDAARLCQTGFRADDEEAKVPNQRLGAPCIRQPRNFTRIFSPTTKTSRIMSAVLLFTHHHRRISGSLPSSWACPPRPCRQPSHVLSCNLLKLSRGARCTPQGSPSA